MRGTVKTPKGLRPKLVPHEKEKGAIRYMRRQRARGRSYRAVCDALSKRGYKPRTGTAWEPMTERRIVLRHTTSKV